MRHRRGQLGAGRNATDTDSSTVASVSCSGSTIRPFESINDESRWVPEVPTGCTR